jgi:hypothetical protein
LRVPPSMRQLREFIDFRKINVRVWFHAQYYAVLSLKRLAVSASNEGHASQT